jgi:hypothetical protein
LHRPIGGIAVKYTLYGVELEVQEMDDSEELLVMEGLQYVTSDDGVIYVLQSIYPEVQWLKGCELYTGRGAIFPIKGHRFCKRP